MHYAVLLADFLSGSIRSALFDAAVVKKQNRLGAYSWRNGAESRFWDAAERKASSRTATINSVESTHRGRISAVTQWRRAQMNLKG